MQTPTGWIARVSVLSSSAFSLKSLRARRWPAVLKNVSLDPDVRNALGFTALELAVVHRRAHLANLLVSDKRVRSKLGAVSMLEKDQIRLLDYTYVVDVFQSVRHACSAI